MTDEESTLVPATAGPLAPLTKIAATEAGAIAGEMELPEEALALLGDGSMAPGAFLAALMAAEHLAEAIEYLAFALPRREAVWWAAQCVRACPLGEEDAPERRAVRAAEAWVVKPSQAACYTAKEFFDLVEFTHPAGLAAAAAFFAGDSLVGPELPKVPPGPDLTARAVSGAVMLSAAAVADAVEIPARQRMMLEKGIDIAQGGTGRDGDGADALPAAET